MTRLEFENTYTRKTILDFLNQKGYRVQTETIDTKLDTQMDQKQLQFIALGIPIEMIGCTKIKKPTMYLATSLVSVLLFFLGFALLFVDPYTELINLSSLIYIVWCLCCLSMFFTNIRALKEWNKRHGE